VADSAINSTSNWPHRLAVLLVCATFPLIWVGGLVTTTKAGMAVPDWPNTYGYNLFLYPLSTWLLGPWDLFIEHGHRLLGALVGAITISVVVAVWKNDNRPWLRVFSILALLAVIGQGVLGGMRVLLDERTLAKIHGCTGPAFFAMAVALAVVTSRWWRETSVAIAGRISLASRGSYARLAMLTTLLAYVQLVLGAQVRHVAVGATPLEFQIAVYFHLFMAAVLVVQIIFLATTLLCGKLRQEKAILRPTLWLGGLIGLQILLGAATWVAKYAWPGFLANQAWTAHYTISAGSLLQASIVTAHVATGSLILVNSLVLALRLGRLQWEASRLSTSQSAPTEAEKLSSNQALAHARIESVGRWQVGAMQARALQNVVWQVGLSQAEGRI
jgi:cytochrome c oxidase assembly protein subunit 15